MITGKTSGKLSEKAAVDLQNALKEASQWIMEVTGKSVEPSNFRAELENGIILCELIERIHPGSIRRINRMNIAMAHLDNLKQFLNACEKFGLKDSQLFDVTDLQVQNTLRLKSGGIKHTTADRRLRNVCVTIYWLGRRLSLIPSYTGPQLDLEAFREMLDLPMNQSSFNLKGYEAITPTAPTPANNSQNLSGSYHDNNPSPVNNARHDNAPIGLGYSKQAIVTSTCEIDLEPLSPPPRVEIQTIQKPPDVATPLQENGAPPEERDDLTPDELIATIQSAVDELLLDYKPSPSTVVKTEHVSPTELVQRTERSYSSPSPTSLSTPSPIAQQPLPLFLDIKIVTQPGVSLGLQLIGGADTAIPAQVEVVMPGKPAADSGLQAGDIIISVMGQDVTRLTHHQLIDFIKQSVVKGNQLVLGVERSVEIAKSDSNTLHEEEQTEVERQKKEIQDTYKKSTPTNNDSTGVTASGGDGHKMTESTTTFEPSEEREGLKREVLEDLVGDELKGEGPEDQEEEDDVEQQSLSDKEEWDVDLDPTTQWQSPAANQLSTQSSVTRLEEELEALNNLVTKKVSAGTPPNSSPPLSSKTPPVSSDHTTSGIGLIVPNAIEIVNVEPDQLNYSENYQTSGSNTSDDESGRGGVDIGSGVSHNNVVGNGGVGADGNDPADGIGAVLLRKEKWQNTRQEADGREEMVTKVTPTASPVRNEPNNEEFDPFAPVTITNSSSSHMLSDVLSLHKTELKTNATSKTRPYQTTPSRHNQPTPLRPYQNAPSRPNQATPFRPNNSTSSKTTPNIASFKDNTHTHAHTTVTNPPQTAFESQDEIQEMHGIKVRAVQRTRWTPDGNRSSRPPPQHSASVDHSALHKKSSIYERRDVVLMEVRGRAMSLGAGQHNSGYNKQGRPWSSQPKRTHQTCSHCRGPIYQGPMMAIPDKDLYFHQKCLVCVVCRSSVSMNYGRATVFLRHSLPHCTSCYSNDNGIKVTTC